MSSATVLTPVSLARGPLIGTFLGLALYGMTCMQAFFYFRTYECDTRRLKMTVALLVWDLTLETAHAAMSVWVMDYYLVEKFGNMAVLASATWSSTSTYILGLVIDFYVYLYFTWRIWLFTKSTWIALFMSVLSISRTVVSIFSAILSFQKPTWVNYLSTSRTFLIIGNMLFIVGDTFLACAMAYHLARFKSWAQPCPPRRIDLLLNRLLIFCVATGALTSLVDVIALVLTLTQPNSLAFLSAILVQTRLYANSLLASLNIRNATSRVYDGDPSPPVELPVLSLRFARPSDLSTVSANGPQEHTIKSWQTTEVASRTFPQV